MSWKSGSSSTVRSYQFLYDNQNFLTWATYLENNTANSRYTTRYVYDSMGNITTLWRYGLRDNNAVLTIAEHSTFLTVRTRMWSTNTIKMAT